MTDDRHDQILDDLEQTGPEYAPDDKLLDAIRGAGFRLTLPAHGWGPAERLRSCMGVQPRRNLRNRAQTGNRW